MARKRRCLGRCGTLITQGSYCKACQPYQGNWKTISAFILRRDDYTCRCPGCNNCQDREQYGSCARTATTVDHIVPVARGGTDDARNLRSMCRSCNSARNG